MLINISHKTWSENMNCPSQRKQKQKQKKGIKVKNTYLFPDLISMTTAKKSMEKKI